MKKWLLLAILALPSLCYSQGVRFDNIALQAANPLQGIPNAVITVCTSAGTGKPCAPLATTYTDATLATPCPGGAQVTLAGSNTCVSTGDSLGNFGFWLAANATYIYTVTAPGLPGYSTSITISCPTSGNCTFTGNVTFNNIITGSITGNAGTATTATTATNLTGPGAITGSFSGNPTLSGNPNFTGNPTAVSTNTGTIASKNFSSDNTQYVSTSGSDSNDGLSWGTAKLTLQAAINTATNSGANKGASVHYACGTYTGPTTFYSGLALWNDCEYKVPGINGGNIALTYSSTLSLAGLTGLYFKDVVFDFGNNGGGISIGNNFQGNVWDGFTIERCGSSTVDCLLLQPTTNTAPNNDVNNTFKNFQIYTNGSTLAQSCITLKGASTQLGVPTNNHFEDGICSGAINNGIVARQGTDTNYFYHMLLFQNGATQANSGCLVLNDQSPTSDVDSDGAIYIGISCGGTNGFTNTIRQGQSTGNLIIAQGGGGGLSIANLGGTPTNTISQIVAGPSSATSDLGVGGKLSVCGFNQASPCYVTGGSYGAQAAGQIVTATATNGGSLGFGSDGNSAIFRNAGTLTIGAPSAGTVQFQQGGSNGANIIGVGSLAMTNVLLSGVAPTIAAGGCGGSAASISAPNGTASFNIFTGTAPTSGGCTITMPTATTDWHCEANHTSAISTTNFIIQQTGALSTTSVTLQLFSDVAAATAPAASDTWRTTCTAN